MYDPDDSLTDHMQSIPEVGDYVQIFSPGELIATGRWYINLMDRTASHSSGCPFDFAWFDRQGYIKKIMTSTIPVTYVLDSGPIVPEDAFFIIRKQAMKKCECGKEKFNFTWHSTFCPQYTSPYGESK